LHVLCVSENTQRIFPHTAKLELVVFIAEMTNFLLRGKKWVFK